MKPILFLVCLMIVTGCASKRVVVAKEKCHDLEVYGTAIPTHLDCEKD